MATISIDYDSHGDVELILNNENTPLNQAAQKASQSSEQKELRYNIGLLTVKVREFHLRVSSAKLISSSSYFEAMLKSSGFREAEELKEHGLLRIKLSDPEDDPTAIMIILGILYGNDFHVPVRLNLTTLYKVAVVVDKYQWQALVTSHATSWFNIHFTQGHYPRAIDETFLRMLFITWLFGMKDHFKGFSRNAQQYLRNSINLMDESIRLSTGILDAINKQRQVAIQGIEQEIEAFKAKLLDPEIDRTFSLGVEQQMTKYMAFGFATFWSRHLELGEFAIPDHAGISIASLEVSINGCQSTGDFQVIPLTNKRVRYDAHGEVFDLKKKLQDAIGGLNMEDWGLNYDDFNPSLVTNRTNRAQCPE